ncbi:uroporphyrinogen-III C-methyltransferase [Piscinibacter sp.]|uniref:uroporphyrinogen-III C-methyltransferase n=1 Tax=Piscinibacter sp. TaxID=1903157 RepID=UPI0039E499C8
MTQGHCTLVGAGPGDPELLTLKAVKAIAAASVLLVDDLVDEGVLVHARPGARIVRVGKRGGCRSTPQAFIEALMIAAARAGEHVVRLKGGDPFVFGRGGEEVERLRAAGIACNVVSGITAALSAASALGVPLTHRDHAQGVMLVTGHAKAGSGAAHDPTDWRALAAAAHAARLTLVIYMGVAGAAHIQRQLLAGGLPPDTPAAVVQHASLPRQRQLLSTLRTLADDLAAAGLGSPAVIVLGDVLRGLAAAGAAPRAASGG